MTNTLKIYQVDAFTDHLFGGNPAAVCILNHWLDDQLMQSIAAENNLSETAFVVPRDGIFEIRWFTPTIEVNLCGHATLATGYVLFNCLNYQERELIFKSRKRGELKVIRKNENLFLDFPADPPQPVNLSSDIEKCLGVKPLEMYKGTTDLMAVLEDESAVSEIQPDFAKVAKLDARALMVTAKGSQVDFVSRFFAPQSGINEDPVTGSAHTMLIPYWSERLNKEEMRAKQLSARGGDLVCIHKGKRCLIGGLAKLYLTGEIYLV